MGWPSGKGDMTYHYKNNFQGLYVDREGIPHYDGEKKEPLKEYRKRVDRRMAIEGALLRETLARPNAHLRWLDGSQNVADVLTKMTVDEAYFHKFIRTGTWTLTQDPAAAAAKEIKRTARARLRARTPEAAREHSRGARRAAAAEAVRSQTLNTGATAAWA